MPPLPVRRSSLRTNGAGQLIQTTQITEGAPRDCYACSLAWQSSGNLQVQCLAHGTRRYECVVSK